MKGGLSDVGFKRLSFAAQKAHALFHLTVHNRAAIVPPPINNREDFAHPLKSLLYETIEQKKERHIAAQAMRRTSGNAPRFVYLLEESGHVDECTRAAKEIVRYCVDAHANVLLVMMVRYQGRPFGPTGTNRPEVCNIATARDGVHHKGEVPFDWNVTENSFLLDLPPTSMHQMDRLLYSPVIFDCVVHLQNEAKPFRVHLPSIACRPHFVSGRQEYRCSYPIVLPFHALKELVNETELRLIVELSLRRVVLIPQDMVQRSVTRNQAREKAGLPPIVSDNEDDVEGS
jgi:hypothetical protein